MFWKKKQQQQQFEKIPTQFIYESKDGTRWFKFENILQLPAKRAISAEVATRFADMNLTKETLTVLIEEMKKAANAGEIVTLFSLLHEIEFRLQFIGEEETLIQLAACYFLIEGEDPADFVESYRNKKIEILKNDSDARGFFLQRSFEFTTNFSQQSGTIILDFLKANQQNAEKLDQILRALKLGNTLKT